MTSLLTLRHEPSGDELWSEFRFPLIKSPAWKNDSFPCWFGGASAAGDVTRHLVPGSVWTGIPSSVRCNISCCHQRQQSVVAAAVSIVVSVADRRTSASQLRSFDQRAREQMIFGTEPFVDMMELSGYAILMARRQRAWD